jgi:uncharacterized membrane protein
MRLFLRVLFVFGGLLILISAYGLLFCSSHIQFERSIAIHQKQSVVFNYLNDFKNYNDWSPWYDKDTTAIYTYSNPTSGPGSMLKWKSDSKEVGEGYIKILSVEADSVIREELNFSHSPASSGFNLKEVGDTTYVRWHLEFEVGANPILRILGKFMDSMVRDDFENGLKNIKAKTEAIPVPA